MERIFEESLEEQLQILHGIHLYHFDIKPENLILRKDFSLVLIDFGVTKMYSTDEEIIIPFEGTRAYWPPEMFKAYRDNVLYKSRPSLVDLHAKDLTIQEINQNLDDPSITYLDSKESLLDRLEKFIFAGLDQVSKKNSKKNYDTILEKLEKVNLLEELQKRLEMELKRVNYLNAISKLHGGSVKSLTKK